MMPGCVLNAKQTLPLSLSLPPFCQQFPISKTPTPLEAAPLSSSATAAGTPARERWCASRAITSTSAASPAKVG